MIKIVDIDTARRTILKRDFAASRDYPPALLEGVERIFGPGVSPSEAVAQILASVREAGDTALERWMRILDQTQLVELRISPSEISAAGKSLTASLLEALNKAAMRIRAFHERQPIPSWTTDDLGGTLGQRMLPIGRVGVYVPGGSAPLPSSLLMSVIPAQVAGVEEIMVCTPPKPHPAILAAAHICGIEELYQVGGLDCSDISRQSGMQDVNIFQGLIGMGDCLGCFLPWLHVIRPVHDELISSHGVSSKRISQS